MELSGAKHCEATVLPQVGGCLQDVFFGIKHIFCYLVRIWNFFSKIGVIYFFREVFAKKMVLSFCGENFANVYKTNVFHS